MNLTKKTIGLIVAGITILALIIGGIFFLGSKSDTPVPGNDSTVGPTAIPSPTNAKGEEVPLSTTTDPAKAQEEINESRKFEEAKETEGFSKEEVQEVMKTATEYSYNSLTNNYYLSGQWDEENMPNNLDAAVGRFFTKDIRKKIMELDTNPETGSNIGTNVFPLVFFVRPNGNITPNEVCRTDYSGSSPVSCPVDGLEISDITYVPTAENDVPGIRVTFSATAKIPIKIDGNKDGFSTVKYSYDLNFIRNVDVDAEVNPNKFVIDWYQVQTNMSAVEEIK